MFKRYQLCVLISAIVLTVCGAFAQAGGRVKGVLTDDSGAVIPAAPVALSGGGVEKSAQTQADGSYTFTDLAPGQYTVRVAFPGFRPFTRTVTVSAGGAVQVPIQLALAASKQEITVAAQGGPSVSLEPDNNGNSLVLKNEDLAALPDDPDDLADALQALAGPSAGPSGGQIYIDGFSGGQLPPKESIREIRINNNPFSAEYDRLGFGRIEILTRPGTDHYRGTLAFNDSDGIFNSRNPFSSNKPDYSSRRFMGNVGGPINKRASFFLDVNRRQISDNALVNAVYLDPSTLLQQPIQTAVVTPNTRTTISPRLDYQLSTNHTLVARLEYGWNKRENLGPGGYRLPPPYADPGYNQTGNQQNLMLTETAVVSPKIVNETRFQFSRHYSNAAGDLLPQISVSGAFTAGGNNMGLVYSRSAHYELQNNTSMVFGKHTVRFGVRVRRDGAIDESQSGFGGAFHFDGGIAPVLDANYQPVLDASGAVVTEQIQAIEQYRRTLLFQSMGYGPAQIRALGGMPSQFTIQGGNSYGSIVRWDAAPFVQDDWRVLPNLTLSYGLRYEVQSLLGDYHDFAPRFGFAWAPGKSANGQQKTVIRGGFGMFYDRIGGSTFLNAEQLNGSYQLSYTVTNPAFFPNIPATSALTPSQNSIYSIDSGLRSAYMMQSAIGVERQLPGNTTVALTFTNTRALHLMQTVPINAPLPGTYVPGQPGSGVRPYGDAGNLFAYQSGGLMKQNILMANFNTRLFKDLSLHGRYAYNRSNDLPGTPTNPYNYGLDWGRSAYERRHHFMVIGSAALPGNFRLSPFLTAQSGRPYDVTLGRDIFGDTLKNARPAVAEGPGTDVICPPGLPCLNTAPTATGAFLPRNYLTGAGMFSINARLARTFGFGGSRANNAMPGDFGGGRGHRGGGHGHGGGGMRMGGGRGFGGVGDGTEQRYNVTLSVMVSNILNHLNPAGYVGMINSPQFGQPTAASTGFGHIGQANNRRVEMSLRFSF